jgi:hypothetical protein
MNRFENYLETAIFEYQSKHGDIPVTLSILNQLLRNAGELEMEDEQRIEESTSDGQW